jgi:hypothetical protein
MSSKKVGIIAVLTATCIVSNYMLIGFTNVKLMDLIVFVSGFTFGPIIGATIGILSWLVYGAINPYGFSLPILLATSSSEAIYGVLGGIIGKRSIIKVDNDNLFLNNIKFAIIGFLLTFLYDLITNIVSALTASIPIIVSLITGIPFSLLHEVSNMILFFVAASPIIRGTQLVFTGEI